MALSAGFVLLLTVPGMPAFMDSPSWIALAVWLLLGAWLFRNAPTRVGAVSGEVLDALILGQGGRGRLPVTPTERDLGMGIAEPRQPPRARPSAEVDNTTAPRMGSMTVLRTRQLRHSTRNTLLIRMAIATATLSAMLGGLGPEAMAQGTAPDLISREVRC